MDDIALARALHVLAVIHWIGGLAFVTLIILPLARLRRTTEEALVLFECIERRFSAQVRISIPLVGATGLWMTYRLDLWDRFADPNFWWMGAMLGLWLVFMLMLFVIEPLLHSTFEKSALQDPATTFRRMSRLHEFLLLLAALTAFGTVAGAHGFAFF
ncbi:hypothetical protein [Methylovirgula sp. 4M-Z18]|uniref:hypothetical protein n=1 Tax=Methylovirgula sp. 4M-Z18 TaxID=2293567 RepID=UPI000E2FD778|nr:hypothetical protein [Methylovirgula sp. 4M-Z18]RFB79732.1 hypothetical protein DYH55_09675 [Methylovirgula sp. 4M-Z18]